MAEIFPQFTIYRDSISASRLRVGRDRAEMFRADFDTSIHPLQFPEKQAIEGEAHIERPTQRTCDSEAWLCHLAGRASRCLLVALCVVGYLREATPAVEFDFLLSLCDSLRI